MEDVVVLLADKVGVAEGAKVVGMAEVADEVRAVVDAAWVARVDEVVDVNINEEEEVVVLLVAANFPSGTSLMLTSVPSPTINQIACLVYIYQQTSHHRIS